MNSGYFHRLHASTPTRFWVNNPTENEAFKAIEAGAEYCTTNPTYAAKMVSHPEMSSVARDSVRSAVESIQDDSLAAAAVQSMLVKRLIDIFAPIHEASGGTKGWVSIQGDPEKEDESSEILREAEANLALGGNYIAKIPVTRSGLEAIGELAAQDVPIIATEVMSLAQAVAVCETYTKAISGRKTPGPLYVTHITGIFDQYLASWNQEHNGGVPGDVLRWAGFLAGRKQYRVLKERNYPVTILGGGARGLHHFTDFVGADMHITINWKGTADDLLALDAPVENRFSVEIPAAIQNELEHKVPVFAAAIAEDGLSVAEFGTFPPVELFRSMFLAGWRDLIRVVAEVRNEA